MTKASENVFPKVRFSEETAPATPSAGEAVVYVKSDGKLYVKDDTGTETDLTATGGGGGGADFSPILDTKAATDDPPDDEFDDSTGMSGSTNGLDAKWTAVTGSSGTVSLTETAEVQRYDLATRPGWLLLQAGSAADQKVQLRQDYTLADGDSIVLAISPPWAASDGLTGIVNNELWCGLMLNDNDTGYDSGEWTGLFVDVEGSGLRLIFWDGSTGVGATGANGTGGMNVPVADLMYLRILRSGTTLHAFWSNDGSTWMPLGSVTRTATADNVWIFAESVAAAGEPVPVVGVYWIRKGSNSFDPW